MKVIIAGSRTITDYLTVCDAITKSGFQITEVVSGGCKGVDSLGEFWAREHKVPVKQFPADWDMYGKAAGPKRNQQMANYGEALIAVWAGQSRGTLDMIAKAKTKELKVYIHQV
jgi:hypothetical protein